MKLSKQLVSNLLLLIIICSSISVTYFTLNSSYQNLVDSHKREIKNILEHVKIRSLVYVEKYNAGSMSKQEAETEVIQLISLLNKGSDYIWVNDAHAIARVHIRPEVIGTYQISYPKHINQLKGKEIFFETDTNIKPGKERRELKVNGIVLLPEWDWIIGYGRYYDDIESEFWQYAKYNIFINVLLLTSCLLLVIVIRSINGSKESL